MKCKSTKIFANIRGKITNFASWGDRIRALPADAYSWNEYVSKELNIKL